MGAPPFQGGGLMNRMTNQAGQRLDRDANRNAFLIVS